MMHSTGEHTPLLGGIDRGRSSTTQRRRPRDDYQKSIFPERVFLDESDHEEDEDDDHHHSVSLDDDDDHHHNNVSNHSADPIHNHRRRLAEYSPRNHSFEQSIKNKTNNNTVDDGKQDRRTWTKRMVNVLTQQIQKQSANAMAAVTNGGGGGGSLSSTTAIPSSQRGVTGGGGTNSFSSNPQGNHNAYYNNNNSNNMHQRRRPPAAFSLDNKDDDDDDYYEDTFNDQPWRWTCGTHEDDGIWMNTTDRAGTIMAGTVWLLILYSILTMLLLTRNGHISKYWAGVHTTICTLALASHAKTTFTDPGAVASSAVPLVTKGVKFHAMCSICQSYKPKFAHHCRICNRCVTRMDHHCPWMNNCVGAGNLKFFALFLLYTWLGSGMALTLFLANYFFCNSEQCEFTMLEMQLVRVMSLVCLGAWLFTSSMLMSVIYGILTGVGTIDRLKKKATNTWHLSDEEPLPLADVVGSGPIWTWFLPVDPFFPDYDRVMGYATMQRLLREQSMEAGKRRDLFPSVREQV